MMPGFHGVSLLQSPMQVMTPFNVDAGRASDVSDIGHFSVFSVK